MFSPPNRSAAVVEEPQPQITAWGLSLAHRLVLWWLQRMHAHSIVFHLHEKPEGVSERRMNTNKGEPGAER